MSPQQNFARLSTGINPDTVGDRHENSRVSILFVTVLALVAAGFVFDSVGRAHKSLTQDTQKSLDIERHPEEPLELVDIKVSEQSVMSRLEVKRRRGGEGLDNVRFQDKDEWFKRVSVRMRNISGKRIVNVRAYLYFKPPGSERLFRSELAASTPLRLGLVEPNGEIDLKIFEPRWNLTANILARNDVDADRASVSFSVDNVIFSDGLQWNRGRVLRRDPNNPSGLLLDSVNAGKSPAQGADKSLDIERYSNEPLELIELKIGEQPVKDRISIKSRRNDEGFDSVKFKEIEGWYKRVWIRMRNVSGKPIFGVVAHLYFQPSYTPTLFSLPLAASTQLKQGVLEPDADIILTVSEQAWSLTADILKQHGVEPDLASVKFRIDMVRFSDDMQWSKGHQLRRDPHNPNRWNVTDLKPTP